MTTFGNRLRSLRKNRYAVVVTDRALMPAWSGNRVRIMGLIRCLRAAGWCVAVVGSGFGSTAELAMEVDELVFVRTPSFPGGRLDSFQIRPYRRAVAQVVAALRAEVIIAEYAWMAPAMANLPRSVRRYVDCHDLLHERTQRFTAAGLDPWVYCSKEQERRLLRYADVLIAIQHRDAASLKRLLPEKKVACLLPYVELPPKFRRTSSDTLNVLTVGANHAGNDGIFEFSGTPWSRVISKIPRARLQIVGAIADKLQDPPGIEAIGTVDDIYHYYESAAVVVCPLAVGTGLKIKMVEALRLGKAVVATEVATEGLPDASRPAWITVPSIPACADAVVRLLSDSVEREKLEAAAFAYGQKYLSEECAIAGLHSILPNRVSSAIRRLIS